MIIIRSIRKEEISIVKRIIHTTAYKIFGFDGTIEDSIQYYEDIGIFHDMEDIQSYYFDDGGEFLVALNGEQVIGSGALRKLDICTSELKRMWLLESYQGQGIGYRLIKHLFNFACNLGYNRIFLQSSPEQTRALAFYRKLGFVEIPCYNDEIGEISMGIQIPNHK